MRASYCALALAVLLATLGCEGNVSGPPSDLGAYQPAPPEPMPPGDPVEAAAAGAASAETAASAEAAVADQAAVAGEMPSAAPSGDFAAPAAADDAFGAAPAAGDAFAAPAPAEEEAFGAAPTAGEDAFGAAAPAADDAFGAAPANDDFGAPAAEAGFGDGTAEAAAVGAGAKGRNYGGPGMVTTPVQQYFRAGEQIAFNIQIPNAMKLYKAGNNDRGPKTHEEFMSAIVKENGVQLPDLPVGDAYVYDPKSEQLLVVHPAQ